jgi:sugar diacid utilization regulator
MNSTGTQRPELVNDGDIPYPRLVKTLISDGQAVGVMVLTAYLQPLGENDAELLELIASFAIPCLLRERYHLSADSQATENYFIKLLDGAAFSRDRVNKRLEVLGYAQREYTYTLVICAREGEDVDVSRGLDEILNAFAGLRSCSAFLYQASLVCVYGSDSPVTDWDRQVPRLKELLDEQGLVAGVSRRMDGMDRLKAYYDQAQSVLEVGRQLGRAGTCYPYDSLSSFLLFGRIPPEQLHLYCHQQIRELGQYDRVHNTDLCVTLQVYLEQTKSLVHTAEILFVHRNTVRYRINKCMELLGSSLEDGNEIFAFILSLRILEYESKFLRK